MSSLLSVLLVSSSSSGSRLLFAYPPNAVATPRVQRPLYGKSPAVRDVQSRSNPSTSSSNGDASSSSDDEDSGKDMFGSRFIRGESSSSSSSSSADDSSSSEDEDDENGGRVDYVHDEYLTREQRQKETYKTHLGVDTSVLGTLLCPSGELCNKRFEMVVNHLAFIAHPVSKTRSGASKSHTPAAPASRSARYTNALSRTNTFETTFGSDEEDDNVGAGQQQQEQQNQQHSIMERRRGRRPRDLRTSIGEESVQARMAYRATNGGGVASGVSSRRTSHSLPGGSSRPQGLSQSRQGPNATRESSSTRMAGTVNTDPNTHTGENGKGRTVSSSSASSTSAPPPRTRRLSTAQLQMSSATTNGTATASTSAGAGTGETVDPSSSSTTTTFPSATRPSSSSSSLPAATPTLTSVPLPLPSSTVPESDLNVFSIVLVIDSPPDQHLTFHLGIYYRDVIAPVMAALKSIEKSARYMTRETELIASMREKAVEVGTSLTPHIEELKRESDLCAQLAALYHGVKDSGMAELVFNDDIEMTVILHSELFDQHRSGDLDSSNAPSQMLSSTSRPGQYGGGGGALLRRKGAQQQRNNAYDEYNSGGPAAAAGNGMGFASSLSKRLLNNRMTDGILEGPPLELDILPWQTLLPLIDPEEMLRSLDNETEDDLTRFLEIMNPTLTFTEYETLLDTDSDAIIAIAEHLVYFRRAKLIDAISLKCIYVPTRPTRPGYVKLLAIWTMEFATHFPDLPSLPTLLSTLSSPAPFESLLPPTGTSASHLRGVYLDALTWLLRHDLIYQMRLYATLIATPEIKRMAYEREEARQKRLGSSSAATSGSAASGKIKGKGGAEADSESEIRGRTQGEAGEEGGGSSGFSERTTSSHTTIAGSMPRAASASRSRREGGRADSSSLNNDSTLSTTPASISSSGKISSSSYSASSGDGTSGIEPQERGGLADNRSPLPSSYPSSYPYMSAVSASAAARPTSSSLHRRPPAPVTAPATADSQSTNKSADLADSTNTKDERKENSSKARKIFLSALNAPSIITNPGDPSAEEDLWIQEIKRVVVADIDERSLAEGDGVGVKRKSGSGASIAIFDKILPFLDGSHSLEEILHRSSITRKALRGVLSDFGESIVTFLA